MQNFDNIFLQNYRTKKLFMQIPKVFRTDLIVQVCNLSLADIRISIDIFSEKCIQSPLYKTYTKEFN